MFQRPRNSRDDQVVTTPVGSGTPREGSDKGGWKSGELHVGHWHDYCSQSLIRDGNGVYHLKRLNSG